MYLTSRVNFVSVPGIAGTPFCRKIAKWEPADELPVGRGGSRTAPTYVELIIE